MTRYSQNPICQSGKVDKFHTDLIVSPLKLAYYVLGHNMVFSIWVIRSTRSKVDSIDVGRGLFDLNRQRQSFRSGKHENHLTATITLVYGLGCDSRDLVSEFNLPDCAGQQVCRVFG
jgi:hypothetical protein